MDGDQVDSWRNASKSFPVPYHHSLLQHKQVVFGRFGIYTGVIRELRVPPAAHLTVRNCSYNITTKVSTHTRADWYKQTTVVHEA